MKRLQEAIATFRKVCEMAAVVLFFLYWPVANLYWVVCAASGLAGKAVGSNAIGEALGVVSVLMAFMVPIWALTVIGIYHLAAAFAMASFRPLPLMLFLVAFLGWERYIPNGHLGIVDVSMLWDGEHGDWSYPLSYSVLAILAGILVLLPLRRKHGTDLTLQG